MIEIYRGKYAFGDLFPEFEEVFGEKGNYIGARLKCVGHRTLWLAEITERKEALPETITSDVVALGDLFRIMFGEEENI